MNKALCTANHVWLSPTLSNLANPRSERIEYAGGGDQNVSRFEVHVNCVLVMQILYGGKNSVKEGEYILLRASRLGEIVIGVQNPFNVVHDVKRVVLPRNLEIRPRRFE